MLSYKGEFNFELKDNAFDDIKANVINQLMTIVERKVQQQKYMLKRNPLLHHAEDDEDQTSMGRQAKLTVKQLDLTQIYKKKQIRLKDALKLAHLEHMPQAYYLYKQRNDVLIDKLKIKEREKLMLTDKINDRCVS